ncbi:hypothetical protein DHW03_16550 [Pedobacter yonginense]|uniref:Methyltransferase FkbM domain-containing protein n=1 Tax=Pedobacter yonginense TaxID=651869 RepID=A0A317EHV7_9SPHI|nr:FkbM family methyltransferase [Pedobacter yonginense]PWS26390.1 hypothetical protein DHW03_16550 [Pedobacter yonginense]
MFKSLKNLYQNEYNKKHVFFAFCRFVGWKTIRLLGLNQVKYSLWGDRKILLDGRSFHSMWLMYNYIVDWEEFNLIQDYLKPADTVLDIGTNMGYYTVWISKFIGEKGEIHCFEPDASNFDKLKRNIQLNHLEKIARLNNTALSNMEGLVSFTQGLDGRNHINLNNSTQSIPVKAKKLDDYARENNIQHISYAKIDVEGFEFSVLQGAEQLLNEKRIDILQLEINITLENSNHDVHDILELLRQHDYRLCAYHVDRKSLHPISYTANRENYFAVHNLDFVNQRLSSNP